jgi:hypothetical protein
MRSLLLIWTLWGALSPVPQDIGWLKLDQAKAVSAHTNKLILVYVACDPRSGNAPCSGGAAERVFSDPLILKRQEEFHFVRVCEKKTALAIRATKPPEAIILDADGDEVYRSGFTDVAGLDQAMSAALLRYAPREIRWAGEVGANLGGKPLLIVGFDDEKGEMLKPFEDRTLAKYHDRIEFVRYSLKKDVDAAKKWGVTQGPAVFICDATRESPEKYTLEKLAGKKNAAALKAAIQKCLLKVETPRIEIKK